jgi:hypothetical protein
VPKKLGHSFRSQMFVNMPISGFGKRHDADVRMISLVAAAGNRDLS